MTCLYLLLQLAHLFMQLLARSNLIEPVSTLAFLAALLLEALRNRPRPEELSDPHQAPFQIRFTRAPPGDSRSGMSKRTAGPHLLSTLTPRNGQLLPYRPCRARCAFAAVPAVPISHRCVAIRSLDNPPSIPT